MISYGDEPDRWPTEPDDLLDEQEWTERWLNEEDGLIDDEAFKRQHTDKLLESLADIARTMATIPLAKRQAE